MRTREEVIRRAISFVLCAAILFVSIRCLDNDLFLTEDAGGDTEEFLNAKDNSYQLSGECLKCTFIVPPDSFLIDGNSIGTKPGDVICLDAAIKYGPIRFSNINGTEENPVTITNCNGKAFVDGTEFPYSIKTIKSRHFRITGGSEGYGIVLMNAGTMGLALDYLSTNFEVDHIEVANVGFAGIMAKTDPSCDDATVRENFTMRDISFHDNFIHFTGGEGLYIGNSFYSNGVNDDSCGVRLPHSIEGVKIYNNFVQFTGWDGIQLGAATHDAEVYNNSVQYFGTAGQRAQGNGIQIGEGTGGRCYNNFIKSGSGNGIIMLGLGDNEVIGNVIINSGNSGIFCDERYTPGWGFRFSDNIIINPHDDGIRLYSEKVLNVVEHNLVVNPGSYWKYDSLGRPVEDAFLYKNDSAMRVVESHNIFTNNIEEVREMYEAAFEYNAINQPSSHLPFRIYDLLKNFRED